MHKKLLTNKVCKQISLSRVDTSNPPQFIRNIDCCEVLPSKIHGYGLLANMDISKGELLCLLDGQYISYQEYERFVAGMDDLPFIEWNALDGDMVMVRMLRTQYSFINHSRQPNCLVENCYPFGNLKLITSEAIQNGHELLLDYRNEPLPLAYKNGYGATYL